jgi:ribosomal protein uS4
MLSEIRGIARALLGATEEERAKIERQYLKRLNRLGILPETASIDNILDLTVKDLMERRLQTVIYRQGLARTIHQARQFVTHGHISVAGKVVSIPGYLVERASETRIAFHPQSSLNNPQHPVRAVAGARRALPRAAEEAGAAVTGPELPEVPPEIKEIVQAEQPLVLTEPEEELPAEGEAEEQKP